MNLTLCYTYFYFYLDTIWFSSVNIRNDINWFSNIKLSFNSWNQLNVIMIFFLIYIVEFDSLTILELSSLSIRDISCYFPFLYCPCEVFISRLFWLHKTSWEVFLFSLFSEGIYVALVHILKCLGDFNSKAICLGVLFVGRF